MTPFGIPLESWKQAIGAYCYLLAPYLIVRTATKMFRYERKHNGR